jgi:hypothetical protein
LCESNGRGGRSKRSYSQQLTLPLTVVTISKIHWPCASEGIQFTISSWRLKREERRERERGREREREGEERGGEGEERERI